MAAFLNCVGGGERDNKNMKMIYLLFRFLHVLYKSKMIRGAATIIESYFYMIKLKNITAWLMRLVLYEEKQR